MSTVECKTCKDEKNIDEFKNTKIYLNCRECREKNSPKKEEIETGEIKDPLIKITTKKLYEHLKSKYGIIEDFECVINICKEEEFKKLKE